ncbi:MAG: response regulator transcription factor, partial [Clostridia bacterium]
DEANIASFISTVLVANDFSVLKALNGKEAMMLATSHLPDLIILDLGLPDMDGQSIIKSVRSWSQIPILVVSARTHERDKVEALDSGADDYITKPFGTSELLARIRAALRHQRNNGVNDEIAQEGKFVNGDIIVDYDKRHVFIANSDAHLTQNEYKIIELLSKHAGKVLTYDYIIKCIWGPNGNCDNRILRVNMANIRRKIEINPAEPKYIYTEMGVGYRMIESEQ